MMGGDPRIIKYREATQQRFPRPFKLADVDRKRNGGSVSSGMPTGTSEYGGEGWSQLYPGLTTPERGLGSQQSSIVGELAWDVPSIGHSSSHSHMKEAGGAGSSIHNPLSGSTLMRDSALSFTGPGGLSLNTSALPSTIYAPSQPMYSAIALDQPRSPATSEGSRGLLPDITDTDVSHDSTSLDPAPEWGGGMAAHNFLREPVSSGSSSPRLDEDDVSGGRGERGGHSAQHDANADAHNIESSRSAEAAASEREAQWQIVQLLQSQVLELQRQLCTARVLVKEAVERRVASTSPADNAGPDDAPPPTATPQAASSPGAGHNLDADGMAVATGEGARHPGDVERIKRLEEDVDMLMMDRDKLMREKVAWYIERAHLGQETQKLREQIERGESRRRREELEQSNRAEEALQLLKMRREIGALVEDVQRVAYSENQWTQCMDARSGQRYWLNTESSQSITWCLWPLTKTVFYVPRVPAIPTPLAQQQQLQQQQLSTASGGDSQNIAPPPADSAGTLSFPPNVVPVSPGVTFRGGAHEGVQHQGAYQGTYLGAEPTTPGGRKKTGIISSIFGSRKNR